MQDIVAIYWFNCPNCSIGADIVGWNSGIIMVNESSFWWGTEVIGKAFREIDLFTGEDKVVIYGAGDSSTILRIVLFRPTWWLYSFWINGVDI